MPGLILFRRRWAIASDDLFFPSILLICGHVIWLTVEILVFILIYRLTDSCSHILLIHVSGYVIMLSSAVILEFCIGWIAKRGAITNISVRKPVRPFLYIRCALFSTECGWTVFGVVWLGQCYAAYPLFFPKAVLLGIIIFNLIIVFITLMGVYLSYDLGGSKWLKLRKYEANLQSAGSKLHHGSGAPRNWRTRKTVRAYQTSWNRRCRFLFCCLSTGQRSSLGEIAQLLSDFFRDLDLVPSDIVAGLVLLRRYQKLRRLALLAQNKSNTVKFLSGVPITEDTKFLDLSDPVVLKEYGTLVRYMRFSLAVYGWPMYVCRGNSCCKLFDVIPGLRGLCCFWLPQRVPGLDALDDNCCMCNSSAMWAVMEHMAEDESIQFVHASYTGGVGMTPYFLALDHLEKKIVVTIRGTLSMKDIVTDLNADAEFIPVNPLQTNPPWLAHKGMVAAAEYVKKKLIQEGKLKHMLEIAKTRTGAHYDLLLVGHSLGGGTAAILAIMLKPEFPTLKCICFSPPGGLLNLPAAEYTSSFITTCLLGKDMVTRLGLHQLEAMRSDLLNVIQRSTCPKWRIMLTSVSACVFPSLQTDPALNRFAEEQAANLCREKKAVSPYMTTHPPMYLPGKIIHIVRKYPDENMTISNGRSIFCRKSHRKGLPVYQAIEAQRSSFYEISLSPSMVDDHMPDTLLSAMEKVLETFSASSGKENGFKTTPSLDHADSYESPSSSVEFADVDSRMDLPYGMIASSFAGQSVGHPASTCCCGFDNHCDSAEERDVRYDLNLPFADSILSPASPGTLSTSFPVHPTLDRSITCVPIPKENFGTRNPEVRIYASLVDEGTSCYAMASPDSTTTFTDSIQADVHAEYPSPRQSLTPDAADWRNDGRTRVSKAKSLTDMPQQQKRKDKRKTSSDRLSTGGSSASTPRTTLQIPNHGEYYPQPKWTSHDNLALGRSMSTAAHAGAEYNSCATTVSTPLTSTSRNSSFASLTERSTYGTIYYV